MYVDGCVRCCRSSPGWCILAVVLLLAVPVILLTLTLPRKTSHDLVVSVYGHEVDLPSPVSSRGAQPPIPSVMMDLFRRGPHDQLAAEIVRSLTPSNIDRLQHRQPQDGPLGREHLHLLTFDVPAMVPDEALHSAQLRLTLTYAQPASGRNLTSIVRIYWDSPKPCLSQQVHDQALEKTINFNCSDVIQRFHKLQGNQNAGDSTATLQLLVGVTLIPDLEVYPQVGGGEEDHDKLPLLLLLYSPVNVNASGAESADSRPKRDLAAEEYEEGTNRLWSGALSATPRSKGGRSRTFCRRRPLYVEFSEINYDTWIVAPNGYQAYQCIGRCMYPLSDHLSPTKHAIIQTLLHSLHPAKAQRPCCVPTRLDSISILYIDTQGVLTYRLSYKEMVVAECGCR